jgi:hypothetical protein
MYGAGLAQFTVKMDLGRVSDAALVIHSILDSTLFSCMHQNTLARRICDGLAS